MCTQNTHEVDPYDSTMVQGSLLEILACKQNPHEYRPVEELSIWASQARTRKRFGLFSHGIIRFFQLHTRIHLLKVVLAVVEAVSDQELQHSNSRQDNQSASHNS
jgi:hypothetical protein